MKIYSREEIGLRKPVGISSNFNFLKGGVALHYGGPGPTKPPTDLQEVFSLWRAWQKFHIDGRGWKDIAYSFGVSDAGHVLMGRGFNTRCGANGTNDANERYGAICWLGGGNAKPSDAAIDAIVDLIAYAREQGAIGIEVRPHNYFVKTDCPNGILTSVANDLHGKPILPMESEDDDIMGTRVRVPSKYKDVYGEYTTPDQALRAIWTLSSAAWAQSRQNEAVIREVAQQVGLSEEALAKIVERVNADDAPPADA